MGDCGTQRINIVLRVMVDNHNAAGSSQGNQCYRTNGYVAMDIRS